MRLCLQHCVHIKYNIPCSAKNWQLTVKTVGPGENSTALRRQSLTTGNTVQWCFFCWQVWLLAPWGYVFFSVKYNPNHPNQWIRLHKLCFCKLSVHCDACPPDAGFCHRISHGGLYIHIYASCFLLPLVFNAELNSSLGLQLHSVGFTVYFWTASVNSVFKIFFPTCISASWLSFQFCRSPTSRVTRSVFSTTSHTYLSTCLHFLD